MKETAINAHQLKTIISDIKAFSLYKIIVPVSWGLWNVAASIVCIYHPELSIIAWSSMIGAGLLSHFIFFFISKKRKGYELTTDSVYKWLWAFIIIAIVEICFIFPEITNFYNRKYTLAFAVLLVGTGLCITGKLQKVSLILFLGIVWIITSNIILFYPHYVYHIYAALSFVTLILAPIASSIYFSKSKQHD